MSFRISDLTLLFPESSVLCDDCLDLVDVFDLLVT